MQKKDFELVGISQLPLGEVVGFEEFLSELGFDNPRFIRYIDTVDDIRAGKRHELVKLKPYTGVINESKIQLFNAKDGALEVEATSHNLIASRIAQMAFCDWFYERLKWGQAAWNVGVFGKMKLSDWGGAEDAGMRFMLGKVIGAFASNTYHGISAAHFGTLNTGESSYGDSVRSGVLKMVFDFATNVANGTIRSIWFGTVGTDYYASGNSPSALFSRQPSTPAMSNVADFCVDSSKVYVVLSSAYATISKRNPATMAEEASLTISGISNIQSICWGRDGYLYALAQASSAPNYRILRIDLSTFTYVDYDEIPTGASTYMGNGIAVFNGKIYYMDSSSQLREVDKDTGALLNTYTYTGLGIEQFNRVQATATELILTYNGNWWSFDSSWNRRMSGIQSATSGMNFEGSLSVNNSYPRAILLPNEFPFCPGSLLHWYYGTWYYRYFQDAVCHTKLAADIDKTSANTMKVTYQFNVALPF
jgi:hypothetical protein